MKNIDTFVCPKSRYRICEDFALENPKPFPSIIIADGCSSSAQSATGAMLLAHAAARELRRCLCCGSSADSGARFDPPDYVELGFAIIHRAWMMAESLFLHKEALDATLMLSFFDGESVRVYAYGDGIIAAGPDNEGRYQIIRIQYPDNAPYYLNYWPDRARRQAYIRQFSGEKIICRMDGTTRIQSYDHPSAYRFPASTPVVLIASDGLTSFVSDKEGRQNPIPLDEVVSAFTSFKNYTGEFLKRRAKRALNDFEKQGFHITDDLSVGAMISAGSGIA